MMLIHLVVVLLSLTAAIVLPGWCIAARIAAREAAEYQTRAFAKYCAEAEPGQRLRVRAGKWVSGEGLVQHRTVTYAGLKAQQPVNWRDYDPAASRLKWWDYQDEVETISVQDWKRVQQDIRDTHQPRAVPSTAAPSTADLQTDSTRPLTAGENYILNTEGAARLNYLKNGGT